MDKKTMIIAGVGIIGVGALFLMRPTPTYQPGGFAGGISKKEGVTVGPTETTETVTETGGLGDTIYNIVFPDPQFPDIPQAPISEPWWVTSIDPPETKKETINVWESVRFTQAATGGQHAPSLIFPSPSTAPEITKKAAKLRQEHAPGWGVFAPTLAGSKGLVEYTERREEKTVLEEKRDIATDILRRLGRG